MTKDQRSEIKDWKRMWFKQNKVWVATDAQGTPVFNDGKVLIKYQIKQDYEYWVNKKNVRNLDSPPIKPLHPKKSKSQNKKSSEGKKGADRTAWDETEYKDKICLFTDGASSGNPGPSGIGVLLRYGEHEKEISEYIGNATNNIAELIFRYKMVGADSTINEFTGKHIQTWKNGKIVREEYLSIE